METKLLTLEDYLKARANLDIQLNLYRQAKKMKKTPPNMDLWIKFFKQEN